MRPRNVNFHSITPVIWTHSEQGYQYYGISVCSNVPIRSMNCSTKTLVRSFTVMFIWNIFTFCLFFSTTHLQTSKLLWTGFIIGACQTLPSWGIEHHSSWAYLIIKFFFGSHRRKQRSLNLNQSYFEII